MHPTLPGERNPSTRSSESFRELSSKNSSEDSKKPENKLDPRDSLSTPPPPPTGNMLNSNVSENKDSIDSILTNIITNIKDRSTRWKIVQNLEKVTLLENIRKNLDKYNKENTGQEITDIKSAPQALKDLIRVVCAEHRNLKLFSPEKTQSTQELEKLFSCNVDLTKLTNKEVLLKAVRNYGEFEKMVNEGLETDPKKYPSTQS